MLGSELAVPALKRRRILGEVVKPVKQESFTALPAKLKRYLRLATPPCFISSQFVPESTATLVLNSK